jgi:amidase
MDVLGYMANSPDVFRKVSKVLLGEDSTKVEFKKLLIAKDCFDVVNPNVYKDLKPAIDHIGKHLAAVEEVVVSPEGLDKWIKVFQLVQGYEVWESYGGWISKYRPRLSRGPKERLEWVSTITRKQYKEAFARKEEISQQIRELVSTDGILCLPTAASIAPLRSSPLEEINATRLLSTYLLCISPLSGIPQFTLPMILSEGVPLGLSLFGAFGSDLALAEFSATVVESFLNKDKA